MTELDPRTPKGLAGALVRPDQSALPDPLLEVYPDAGEYDPSKRFGERKEGILKPDQVVTLDEGLREESTTTNLPRRRLLRGEQGTSLI